MRTVYCNNCERVLASLAEAETRFERVDEINCRLVKERDAALAQVAELKVPFKMDRHIELMKAYDNLQAKLTAAEAELEERRVATPTMNAVHILHAENAKLRAALEKIARHEYAGCARADAKITLARDALGGGE